MDINYDKTIKTIVLLDKFFYKKEDDIANVEIPSEIELFSNDWMHYIFYSCLLDYGMKSKLYHGRLINTYSRYSKIFIPEIVVKLDIDELDSIIRNNIRPRYPNVALKKWLKLSSELVKYDNLVETIKNFNSFQELNQFIHDIGGFGQKTGGLLLRLIYEAGVCSFDDGINTLPLDRHDIEISYLNRIINKDKLNKKEIAMLNDTFFKVSNELNIKINLIDKYLWEVGNRFCNKKDCLNCPLFDNCKTKLSK